MYRGRHAKIVATLGPASTSREVIRTLFDKGVDVFRLNFSHGDHADHAERLTIIRDIERETGRPIGVMADMQGPKLRVGASQTNAWSCRPARISAWNWRSAPAPLST